MAFSVTICCALTSSSGVRMIPLSFNAFRISNPAATIANLPPPFEGYVTILYFRFPQQQRWSDTRRSSPLLQPPFYLPVCDPSRRKEVYLPHPPRISVIVP